MPQITRVFVKSALLYLVLGLLMGLLSALPRSFLPVGVGPVTIHLLTIGWLTQLIAGVAYWMFPKQSRERPRGHDGLMWAAYGLFNVGLILRAVVEPIVTVDGRFLWGWLLVVAACCLWLAGVMLVVNLWPRVKER
jgi:heme/copper-type cytochrome/quinol oxidase subunit 1